VTTSAQELVAQSTLLKNKNGDVRPVQNVDSVRKSSASMVSDYVLHPEREVSKFFQDGCNDGTRAFKASQFCFSPDGATQRVKRVQMNLETNDALTRHSNGSVEAMITIDITNAFPTLRRQIAIDMTANVASIDYKDPDGTILIAKGTAMPSKQIFKLWLPLMGVMYGDTTKMMHHHPGRFGKTIDFGDGFSQGCPSGSMACALSIQFVAYLTALKHPSEEVELLAFQDDCNFLGDLVKASPIVHTFIVYLRHFLNVEVSSHKSQIYIPHASKDCTRELDQAKQAAQ